MKEEGEGQEEKKKKDIYKRGRGQPDNKRLRQSTITSYFPRYRSNQFCPSPKNNRPVPRSVSRRYSRREHSTCRSQVLQDSIQSRSCLTHPRIVEQEKEKEKKKRGKKHGGGVAGSCLIPSLPPFQTSLSSFHLFHGPSTFFLSPFPVPGIIFFFSLHPFSYPSLTFTFFCYRLRAVRDSL